MSKLNAAWHASHRMPAKATLDQRVEWHLAHAVACGCRSMPKSVVEELKKRGMAAARQSRTK